ncbi:hypothetical protein ACFO5R_07855 [Halosolutus amylolyticus]|uniref:Uncharacterized protein n=1 Tax=Halosolutus amylolyticus TaxID=2932267 RepID=A0ABD5PMZ9_9EURY|nr:hypothetical protein [Halosolutus amylolyticus]
MDSKRPDVRMGEKPDEEGRITRVSADEADRSLVDRLIAFLKR